MYKIKNIKKEELIKIHIHNQQEIIDTVGYALNPAKAYEIIKESSDNFTNNNPEALQADKLLFMLWEREQQGHIHSDKKGNKWQVLNKEKAQELLGNKKEVFGFDKASNTYISIKDKMVLKEFEQFAIPLKSKAVKSKKITQEVLLLKEKERERIINLLQLELELEIKNTTHYGNN